MAASIMAALNGSDEALEQALMADLSKGGLKQYLTNSGGPPALEEVQKIWVRLSRSASLALATEKYITASCNAIAVFLMNVSSSSGSEIARFAFTRRVWLDAINCTEKAFAKGKTKPALQVLEMLCHVNSISSEPEIAWILLKEDVMKRLKTLLVGNAHQEVKVACIVLSCYVRKTDIAHKLPNLAEVAANKLGIVWDQLLHQYSIKLSDLNWIPVGQGVEKLILGLLIASSGLETRSAALKLLTLVINKRQDPDEASIISTVASRTVQLFLVRNKHLLADYADNVLPIILDTPAQWQIFSEVDGRDRNWTSSSSVLQGLAMLRIGRLKSYINEKELVPRLNSILSMGQSTNRQYYLLLRSYQPDIRIALYNLLTTCPSIKEPISNRLLVCLTENFKYLHDDNDAHERGEILSITRRLLRKLSGLVANTGDSAVNPIGSADVAEMYRSFVLRYAIFLRSELYPGLPYSRHILALHSLRLVLDSSLLVQDEIALLFKPLLSLVLDPFEDVRSNAADLLKTLVKILDSVTQRNFLRRIQKRVAMLSVRTCRHDHTDAAARLISLTAPGDAEGRQGTSCVPMLKSYLQSTLRIGPGSDFPLHAMLLGATYQLSDSAALSEFFHEDWLQDSLHVCRKVWHLVQGKLCVDAPETATTNTNYSSAGPKDLLAYAWRALRDSSLLLQAVLQTKGDSSVVVREAGSICIEQLTMLRHRGAFSTVAQTFLLCCEKARTSPDPNVNSLIESWYYTVRSEIDKQAGKLTRRSAGLPALINAILSPADPHMFARVLHDLVAAATVLPKQDGIEGQEAEFPQVHALNCIKDIIHNARLRAVNDQYIGDLLQLAATSLSSNTWAIRNSGLMLLKACMVRYEPDGSTSMTQSSGHDARATSNEPLRIVLGLLESARAAEGSTSNKENGTAAPSSKMLASRAGPRSENIFAALDLVKYIGQVPESDQRLLDLIRQQLGSSVWAIRDHAARVLIDRLQVARRLTEHLLICPIPDDCQENELHGILLFHYHCTTTVLNEQALDENVERWLDGLDDLLRVCVARLRVHSSPFAKAVVVDIFNASLMCILRSGRILTDIDSSLPALYQLCRLDLNSHSRSRVFLARSLLYFAQGTEIPSRKFVLLGEEALQPLVQQLAEYPDEVRYVLEQISRLAPSVQHAQLRLIDYLANLATQSLAIDLRALLLRTLADYVADSEQVNAHFRHRDLKDIRSTIKDAIRREVNPTRDLRDASMRIWPFLMTEQTTYYSPQSFHSTQDVQWLVENAHAASRETTEIPSRLSAAIALREGLSERVEMLQIPARYPQAPAMSALELLIDQLSDDDEDIRHVAAGNVSDILCRNELNIIPPTGFCALAAKEALFQWFFQHFSETDLPPEIESTAGKRTLMAISAVRHIMDVPQHFDIVRLQHVDVKSVADRMKEIFQSMNDLFAEEKQNLYIDELAEVERWSHVLKAYGDTLGDSTCQKLFEWALAGLDELKNCIWEQSAGSHFPLGITYNADMLVVFTRVISLATVLLEIQFHGETYKNTRKQVADALNELKQICMTNEAHERVIMAFEAGRATKKSWTL